MTDFRLKKFDDANHKGQVDLYIDRVGNILNQLQTNLLVLEVEELEKLEKEDKKNSHVSNKNIFLSDTIQALVDASKQKKSIFAIKHADIQKHPELWTKTSRVGGSKIVVDDAVEELSTYKLLNDELMGCLKKLSRFNFADRKKRKEINRTLNKLDQWQKDVTTAYIVSLRDMTANRLLFELEEAQKEVKAKIGDNQETIDAINALIERITPLKKLTSNDLKTSAACLTQTKKVNDLRNDLIKFNKSLTKSPKIKSLLHDFDHLAEQLSIVTKRWIDPFYVHPKELTRIEKARRIAKVIIINLAELLAVTAFILFFVFPPASFPVGAAASIGMLPIFDSFFEVARNIWYGRTPTKAQVMEVGIAVALVLGLTFLAYGVAAIGTSILQVAPTIAQKLIEFGTLMATIFMRFIDVVLNTAGSILETVLFKKIWEPKTVKQLDKSGPRTISKVMDIIRNDEAKTLEEKSNALSAADDIKHRAQQRGDSPGLYWVAPSKKEKTHYDYVKAVSSVKASFAGLFGKKVKIEKNIPPEIDGEKAHLFVMSGSPKSAPFK